MYYTLLHAVLFAYSFVQKPNKGVKFLQERGLVGKEAKDVATFFYEDDRLDRVCNNLSSISVLLTWLFLDRLPLVISWVMKISKFQLPDTLFWFIRCVF